MQGSIFVRGQHATMRDAGVVDQEERVYNYIGLYHSKEDIRELLDQNLDAEYTTICVLQVDLFGSSHINSE